MEECRGSLGLITIINHVLLEEFVMIGMEFCPNGSLERFVEGRRGCVMEENVIYFTHIENTILCKANSTRNEQST